ncbi:MAG: hypothetical protein IH987_10220 [Planctomycetes bacterium]|nr:hypothetical protein [Planctomycetota bacterium]
MSMDRSFNFHAADSGKPTEAARRHLFSGAIHASAGRFPSIRSVLIGDDGRVSPMTEAIVSGLPLDCIA